MKIFLHLFLIWLEFLKKTSQISDRNFFAVPDSLLKNEQCPSFDMFLYWIKRQCPLMTDARCVINLPSDIIVSGLLNCGTSSFF